MELKREKQVRFHNEEKQNLDPHQSHGKHLPLYKNSKTPLKSEGGKQPPKFGRSKIFPEGQEPKKGRILDPGSEIVLKWNRIFLCSCLVALFVDPLFFYLPSVMNQSSDTSSCMKIDLNLGIVVTCFRTLADVLYLLHVVIKFRTAYVSPSSRVFGKGELVMDLDKIARRYLRTEFLIDSIAALPLPQVASIPTFRLHFEV